MGCASGDSQDGSHLFRSIGFSRAVLYKEKDEAMKTIGLIGGMSWESTVPYYQIINRTVQKEMGGLHSAKILLYSVDFDEIERFQASGEWEKSGEYLAEIALNLEKAGADFIVLCTNTMHKTASRIEQNIHIELLHIAEVTADALIEQNIRKVGLLGTRYTMMQDFYKNKLIEKGIEVLIPAPEDITVVNDIIYNELCRGLILADSKQKYLEVVSKLQKQGAEGVILGCTEIGLLIKQEDVSLPVFDTTQLHAQKAALLALEK